MKTRKQKWGVCTLILTSALHAGAGLPGTWEIRETSFDDQFLGVAGAPGQLVAVGQGGAIFSSDNAADWVRAPYTAPSGDFHCVTFGGGIYVAGGTLGALLAISADGVNWTNIQSTGSIHANFGVTYGRGRFVAVGRGTTPIPNSRLITSTNGIDWETVPRPTTNTLRAVTFGNGQYVAVGDLGSIITSLDGFAWAVQNSGTEHRLRTVIYTGREFLAGGDSSTLLTSSDGISWFIVPFSSFDVRALATSGTAVVAVGALGTEGRVQVSADGLSWSNGSLALPAPLTAVVHYELGRFVAVGHNGLIIENATWADPPVNTWTKTTDGYWQEAFWSLGHVPSWKDRSIVFTNAGSKTLEIGSSTTRDYPDSLLISELILDAPEGSHNTLFLNQAGLALPLLIDRYLVVPANTSLINIGSALEGSQLNLSSSATFGDGSRTLFRNGIYVGMLAPAQVVQSNAVVSSLQVALGNFPATWTQFGGTNETESLRLGGNSAYHLQAGSLAVAGDLQLGDHSGPGGPQLNIGGGAAVVRQALRLVAGEVTLTNGLLTTSNTFVGPNTRFVQMSGEHRVQKELDVQGFYELRTGSLMFQTARVQGTLEFSGDYGWHGNLAFHGGVLNVTGLRYFQQAFVTGSGTIDFQSRATLIRFERLTDAGWTNPLTLRNWTAGADEFYIGFSTHGLSADLLGRIIFVDPGGYPPGNYRARITVNGQILPVSVITYQRTRTGLVLTWPERAQLLTSTNVSGPYELMTGATSPLNVTYADPQRFFVIRSSP